jgi:primosomal replication protein N
LEILEEGSRKTTMTVSVYVGFLSRVEGHISQRNRRSTSGGGERGAR